MSLIQYFTNRYTELIIESFWWFSVKCLCSQTETTQLFVVIKFKRTNFVSFLNRFTVKILHFFLLIYYVSLLRLCIRTFVTIFHESEVNTIIHILNSQCTFSYFYNNWVHVV